MHLATSQSLAGEEVLWEDDGLFSSEMHPQLPGVLRQPRLGVSTIPGMLTPRGGGIYNVVALQESSGPSLFLPGCQQVLSLFPNPIESTHFTSTATILASPDHVTWTTALSHTASGRMNLDIQISACPSS